MCKKSFCIYILLLLVVFSSKGSGEVPVFFPKMTPAETVIYYKINEDDAVSEHICRVFQGIINRESAEVFLASDPHETNWLLYSEKPWKRPSVTLSGKNPGLRTLFSTYKDRIDKLVICNFEDNDYTWNMAVMMACAENALPVSEKIKDELVAEFGWDKEIVDIRNNWAGFEEAYNWALENLMPKLNKQIIFSLGLRSDWRNMPWRLYDYAVASRSFVFWLDNHKRSEKNMIQKILRTPGYAKNTVVMGYGVHGDDLNDAINPEGFGFLVADIFPNASFYSSFPSRSFTQPDPVVHPLENDKIYIALHWSDGDNIQFNHNASYDIFRQSERGKVPVGMTLNPALMEIAPFILDYYYSTATDKDELMGGPSGLQYIQERFYKPSDYDSWCIMNGEWLAACGMNVTASSVPWPPHPDLISGHYRSGILGTVSWSNSSYWDAYNWLGMPVICTGYNVSSEQELYTTLSKIEPSDHRPVFSSAYLIQAPFGGHGYGAINRVATRLEEEFPGRYVFLKPSDLMVSAKAYFESVQKPYKDHSIPGRIEAEDFDLGGQGVGFYDLEKKNKNTEYRTDVNEYVSIGSGASNYCVTSTEAGEWLNYTVNIKEAGSYKVTFNYSSRISVNQGIRLIANDRTVLNCKLEGPGRIGNYVQHSETVLLPEGECELKVQFVEGNMNLDYMEFEKSSGTGLDDISLDNSLSPYPVPFSKEVYIPVYSDCKTAADFAIYNSSGNLLHQEQVNIESGNQTICWSAAEVPNGIYMYVLRGDRIKKNGKLIKSSSNF